MSVLQTDFSAWRPEVIRAAIAMRGMTLSKLALDNGLSESACRQALLRPIPRADRAISLFLRVPLHELWPDRYDENGSPFSHERDDSSDERDGAHRQLRGAA